MKISSVNFIHLSDLTRNICEKYIDVFFILAKKVYSRKEYTKMSKIAKYGYEIL